MQPMFMSKPPLFADLMERLDRAEKELNRTAAA
jgi:hypothetical protein